MNVTIGTSPAYHLRVTGTKEQLISIIDKFIEKFTLNKYLFGYEEKGDNKHMHGHLEFIDTPSRQRISDFFKKHLPERIKGGAPLYYFKEVTKSKESNILYAMKEVDILKHNLSNSQFELLMKKTEEINEDKKLDQRHKLLNSFTKSLETKVRILEETTKMITQLEGQLKGIREEDQKIINKIGDAKREYKWHIEEVCKLSYISRFIHKVYIDDYDKEPPLNHIRGYTLYIASKYKGYEEIQKRLANEVVNYYERMFPE